MNTQKMSAEAFNNTFQAPMQDVTGTAEQLLDIWPYVDAIPLADLDSFELADVAYVYLNPSRNYQHVLVATEDKNVFLVIVIDVKQVKIRGHHLLNMVELYGLAKEID
jgi:hypothetical protein